jgi:VWFA-related protein
VASECAFIGPLSEQNRPQIKITAKTTKRNTYAKSRIIDPLPNVHQKGTNDEEWDASDYRDDQTFTSGLILIAGRKALIVLTDGIDRTSPHGVNDAIEAAQSADARVYTIQYLMYRDHLPFGPAHLASDRLHRLAEETGGRFYSAPKDGPGGIFTQIEEELRTMYVLGFRAPEGRRDGKIHKLEVKSKRRGVELCARKRYVDGWLQQEP